MSKEKDQIWQSIKGAEEVHKIYGYYPTLHDASLINFDVRFEMREISLTFDYCDLIQSAGQEANASEESACTTITLCWHGISESRLSFYNNDIHHIDFQQVGKLIETRFSHSFGINGFILSESINLISVTPSMRDSAADVSEFLHTVNFTFTS